MNTTSIPDSFESFAPFAKVPRFARFASIPSFAALATFDLTQARLPRRWHQKRRSPLFRPDAFRPRRGERLVSECRWTSEEVDHRWRRYTRRDGFKNVCNMHLLDLEDMDAST